MSAITREVVIEIVEVDNPEVYASQAATSATAAEAARVAAVAAQTAAVAAKVAAEAAQTAAAASAATATTKAGEANSSASAAATSATAAEAAKVAAQTAQTAAVAAKNAAETAQAAAAAKYTDFDNRYLGPKSTNPTLDNDGAVLLAGALYWNTTVPEMRVWNGSAWVNMPFTATGALLLANNLSDLSNAATARTNLGVVIGSNVQAWDADLDAIAALATTSFGRSVLTQSNAAELSELAGLVIGTDVQAQDAELAAIAGLVSADNKLPYFTGSGTAALADLTAYGRTLIALADAAALATQLAGQAINNPTVTNYTEAVVAIGNSSTAQTIALTNGTVQTCTLTGNCTFTMPTATAGKSFLLLLKTGAGSFTATFTGVRWSGGTAPTITATANKLDVVSFIADGANWYGSILQNFTP